MSSKWKTLAKRNREAENNNSSISKHERFTPKKASLDQNMELKFHNKTIDKDRLSQSSFSEDRDRFMARSFISRADQPRLLKASSSEAQLHNNNTLLEQPRNSNLLTVNSFINIQPPAEPKAARSRFADQPLQSKLDLIEEVKKLKADFKAFQNIIFNELRRQEKMVNSMVEEIMNQIAIKEARIYTSQIEINAQTPNRSEQQIIDQLFNAKTKLEVASIHGETTKEIRRAPFTHKKNISIEVPLAEDLKVVNQKLNSPSFHRFFEAVNNLKQNIKDLNQLSDVSSFTSPKGTRYDLNWSKLEPIVRVVK